ncbi:hypothetical protein MRX96_022378 [Rhipicephalus microplus]
MSWKAVVDNNDEDSQNDVAFSDSEAAGSSRYNQGDDIEAPCGAAAVRSLDGANSGLLPLESPYRLPSSSFYARRVTPPNVALTDAQEPRNSCMEQDGEDTASSPRSSVTDSEGLSSLSEGSMEDLSESESITDVTPLHSPYMCDSPVPAVKLPWRQTQKRRRLRERSAWEPKHHQREPVDLQLLVDAIRRLEAHQCEQSRARKEAPVKGRKNMSFSNEEVQRIDRENQRLLKRILAQQNRPRPKFDSRTPSRLAPSAINRQRQQRQIEVENLALLKKIESAKPSREVAPSPDHLQRARSHSLSLTRHTLQTPPVMVAAAAPPPLAGVKHFPPRQKHHSH